MAHEIARWRGLLALGLTFALGVITTLGTVPPTGQGRSAPMPAVAAANSATRVAAPAATNVLSRIHISRRVRELVILDRTLADLADALRSGGRQVVIVGGTGALAEAAREISPDSRFAAIHIVTHGDEGQIQFDGVPVTAASLENGNELGLRRLAGHLTPGADILVYGCKSARGDRGQALLRVLARLTGADVAGSAGRTGIGSWSLERRLGEVRTAPLVLPRAIGLYSNELFEGGWYGDTNVPSGSVGPHAKPGLAGSGRLSTMGDNTDGSGVSFSVVSLLCCTAQKVTNASAPSYASAVTTNDYFYSTIVVGGTNGATISKFSYNQVPDNLLGAQFELALYDTVTATLTPITGGLAVNGTTNGVQPAITPVPMIAGRTYQLRFYTFDCGILATCYIDNPQIWTKANEAPIAVSDAFTTNYVTPVSGNLVTNDSDPENQSLTVSAINGGSYTVGTPIALSGGSLTVTSAAGTFVFTPASGLYGAQSFNYTVSDGYGGNSTATVTIAVNQADLSLTGSVASSSVFQGASQSFTLTAASSSASSVTATGITVSAILPTGLTFVAATGSGSYNSSTGIWTLGSLAPGGTATLTITGTATGAKGATVTNTAQITTSSVADPDSTPNNGATGEDDYATASFAVIDPSLTVTKTSTVTADGVNSSNFKAIPGATLSYCVLVTNTGNTTANNVVASDPLPAQESYVTGSARTGPSCAAASSTSGITVSGSTVTATSGSLSEGATFALVFNATMR